jgi:hypothetical protein
MFQKKGGRDIILWGTGLFIFFCLTITGNSQTKKPLEPSPPTPLPGGEGGQRQTKNSAKGDTVNRREINVRDYGAKGDGKTLDTPVINKAIEEISNAGGGTVYIPPGIYLSGTINLKDHVTLYLEHGATILGSTDLANYPVHEPPRPSHTLEYGKHSLVYASGISDFAIVGEGKFYGSGESDNFNKRKLQKAGMDGTEAHFHRPFGFYFVGCKNILVRGITIENAAFWTEDYLDCEDVVVDGIRVDCMKNENNDGIDIDGCRNFRLSNCNFRCEDDGICLKASYKDCENITVTNCVVSSWCNGIKFGTSSNGGYKNIAISNCAVDNTRLVGLALEIVDGATMDGVAISNISMRDVGTAIFIRLGDRARQWTNEDTTIKLPIGILKNISIDNVVATILDRKDNKTPFSSSIVGLPGHYAENISLSNIKITTQAAYDVSQARTAIEDVPEKPSDYPEYSMFGALPAYGFFCRHVDGLTLTNVDLRIGKSDYRSALVFDDVKNLDIHNLKAQGMSDTNPIIQCKDVDTMFIQGSMALANTATFLALRGNCKDITLLGNDFSKAEKVVTVGADVPPEVVFQSGNKMKQEK